MFVHLRALTRPEPADRAARERPTSPTRQCDPGYTGGVNVRQHRAARSRLAVLLATATLLVTGAAAAQQPAAPRQAAPSTPQRPGLPPVADLIPPPQESPEARAARGVVVIQRAGQPVALGSVLAGDGRILTALSPLGSGNELEVKYPDDSVVKVLLGHHDRPWDLALLVPQTGRWQQGLTASSADPLRENAAIRAFSAQQRGRPVASLVDLRSRRALLGGDDRMLQGALEVGSRISGRDLGSPLIDETGRVVGVLGRGCLPTDGKPCVPIAFGTPVSVVKGFLKSAPASAALPAAWLGIQGAADNGPVARGVRVLSVAPGSPAADAGLLAGNEGDTVLAVGGEPVTTPDQLVQAIRKHAVGEKVPLILFGQGRYRQVEVGLRAPPLAGASLGPAPASEAAPAPGAPRVRVSPVSPAPSSPFDQAL